MLVFVFRPILALLFFGLLILLVVTTRPESDEHDVVSDLADTQPQGALEHRTPGEAQPTDNAAEKEAAAKINAAEKEAEKSGAIQPESDPAKSSPDEADPAAGSPADTGPADTGPADTSPAEASPAEASPAAESPVAGESKDFNHFRDVGTQVDLLHQQVAMVSTGKDGSFAGKAADRATHAYKVINAYQESLTSLKLAQVNLRKNMKDLSQTMVNGVEQQHATWQEELHFKLPKDLHAAETWDGLPEPGSTPLQDGLPNASIAGPPRDAPGGHPAEASEETNPSDAVQAAATYSVIASHVRCTPSTWVGNKASDPQVCLELIRSRSDCSHQFFDHATLGDGNCGCVTDSSVDCSNADNQRSARNTVIYATKV